MGPDPNAGGDVLSLSSKQRAEGLWLPPAQSHAVGGDVLSPSSKQRAEGLWLPPAQNREHRATQVSGEAES